MKPKTTKRSIRKTRKNPLKKYLLQGIAGVVFGLRFVIVLPLVFAGVSLPMAPFQHPAQQVAVLFFTPSAVPTTVVKTANLTPQLGLSHAQEQRSRVVLARERPLEVSTPTPEPSFEQKRTLAKQAAAYYGLDKDGQEGWKWVESVWQVESGKSWDTSVQSYAGALGPFQFMRGTWYAHAFVDGNHDGVISINSAADAVYAAAHLLANAGGDRGDWKAALYSYNHSLSYVAHVERIKQSIRE